MHDSAWEAGFAGLHAIKFCHFTCKIRSLFMKNLQFYIVKFSLQCEVPENLLSTFLKSS